MTTYRPLLAGALLAVHAGAFAAAGPSMTQIYQQRTPDGRIVLTDRPSPTAITERSWQLLPEDGAAARQRALDVKREAQMVSERVQLAIDRQQLADFEARRDSADRATAERLRTSNDSSGGTLVVGGGGLLYGSAWPGLGLRNRGGYGYGLRGGRHDNGYGAGSRFGQPGGSGHATGFRGPGQPGSR